MNADEYRRRARRCLVLARQTACHKERARTVDTAMMWMELAEWAEGKWPQGKEQPVRSEKPEDGADSVENISFASEGGQEGNRIKN